MNKVNEIYYFFLDYELAKVYDTVYKNDTGINLEEVPEASIDEYRKLFILLQKI